MAKQVKVFEVTIGDTSTVVYTVPAGRVAKVSISAFAIYPAIAPAPYVTSYPAGKMSVGALNLPNGLATTQPNQSFYLPAGGSVTMYRAYAQFAVVEEF